MRKEHEFNPLAVFVFLITDFDLIYHELFLFLLGTFSIQIHLFKDIKIVYSGFTIKTKTCE